MSQFQSSSPQAVKKAEGIQRRLGQTARRQQSPRAGKLALRHAAFLKDIARVPPAESVAVSIHRHGKIADRSRSGYVIHEFGLLVPGNLPVG